MCFLMANTMFIIIMFISRFMVNNHCWQYRGARWATTLTMHSLICKHGKMIFGLLENLDGGFKYFIMSTPKNWGKIASHFEGCMSFKKGGLVQPPNQKSLVLLRLFAQDFWLGNMEMFFSLPSGAECSRK